MESKNPQRRKSNLVAIITMFFIFAMISFVTNMAAPLATSGASAMNGPVWPVT